MSLIVLYFLYNTSVLSLYIDVVLTLSTGTFPVLLAICAGNSPVTGECPLQRPVTRCFDIFFDLHLNKPMSKQPRRQWFETLSRSLWFHCNDACKSVFTMEILIIWTYLVYASWHSVPRTLNAAGYCQWQSAYRQFKCNVILMTEKKSLEWFLQFNPRQLNGWIVKAISHQSISVNTTSIKPSNLATWIIFLYTPKLIKECIWKRAV